MEKSILTALKRRTGPELVQLFNHITGAKVKRFASISAGLQRIAKACEKDPGVREKLAAKIAAEESQVTVYDDGGPIPDAGEVVAQAILKDIREKPITEGEVPKPVRASDGPTERGGGLWAAAGKIVRKENIQRVEAGEALWGRVGERPAEPDRFTEKPALNLNYPAKPEDQQKRFREGTARADLEMLMQPENGGISLTELAERYSIALEVAIYKIRDLHYMNGAGVLQHRGRVYIYWNDKQLRRVKRELKKQASK